MHNSCYLTHVAQGQLSIQWHKQKISHLLEQPQTSPELQQSLERVNKIREFAQEKMSLKVDQSFQYYIALDREQVAWNVSASEADQLKAITYWFPITGTVPYLGFFAKSKATKKAEKLRSQGYDVQVRGVQGYSTLGWLQDPIFSTQLKQEEFTLAEFMLHETVHSNIWLPGDVTLNESMAEFAGTQGALEYILHYYSELSPEYKAALKKIALRKRFEKLFASYAKQLDALYAGADDGVDGVAAGKKERLLENKALIIAEFRSKWKDLAAELFGRKNVEEWDAKGRLQFNNAHFVAFLTYHTESVDFVDLYHKQCQRDWSCFWELYAD